MTSTVVPTPTLVFPNDRIILEIFYAETDGDNWWVKDDWLTDAPLGDWFGVTTNAEGRVTELDMLSNGLKGELPPELSSLTELTKLRLGNTSINTTPCAPFTYYEDRYRCWNVFSGEIPVELGALTKLTHLHFHATEHLTGEIPVIFTSLTSLEELRLGSNGLTGPIPPGLGNLSKLMYLTLNSNQLTGEIPAELGNLTELMVFRLGNNKLTGNVPPELGNLLRVRSFSIDGNQLQGCVPDNLSYSYSFTPPHEPPFCKDVNGTT